MPKDELLFAALVLAFAAFLTSHVALCLALASRPPRVRALVALVVPPLAPVWGVREGWHKRAALWALFAASYVALRLLAR